MKPLAAVVLAVAIFVPMARGAEPEYRDPGLRTVVQVAILTKDIEGSAQRWAAFLGVPVPDHFTTRPGRESKMVYKGLPSNARVKLAFLKAGQVTIELLEPVGEPSSWKDGLDENGEGFHHLGFQVVDLDRSVAALEAMGYPTLHRGRYDNDDGTYVYMDSRKDLGVLIEILHSDTPEE